MEHGPVLIPDSGIWIQLALFLATYWVLRVWLFKPYLELLRQRRERTDGLRDKAAAMRLDAERLQAEHEAFVRAEHKKLSAFTDEERRKIQEQERAILSAARADVDRQLEEARRATAEEAAKARTELLPLVADYSSQIASKLLGRAVKVKTSSSSAHPVAEEKVVER